MIDELKEFLQAFLAPQLEGIRGDIRALDAKIAGMDAKFEAKFELINAKIAALDGKIEGVRREIESLRREMYAEVRRVEETLSADFRQAGEQGGCPSCLYG